MMVVLKVSVPSRGFGSDDALWSCRGACISLVSVPSRGFGSDDGWKRARGNRIVKSFRPLSGFWV
ncbi:Uncharacterised protein [Mycobacterium tuberculosis]|nr:Uncharacterised protein [Mycobacterium tuberculosis]